MQILDAVFQQPHEVRRARSLAWLLYFNRKKMVCQAMKRQINKSTASLFVSRFLFSKDFRAKTAKRIVTISNTKCALLLSEIRKFNKLVATHMLCINITFIKFITSSEHFHKRMSASWQLTTLKVSLTKSFIFIIRNM